MDLSWTLQILCAIEFIQFIHQFCGFPEILLGGLFTLLRDQEPCKGKWGAEGLTTIVVKSWLYLGEGMCSDWLFFPPWLVCNGQLVGGNDGWVGGWNAGWNAERLQIQEFKDKVNKSRKENGKIAKVPTESLNLS